MTNNPTTWQDVIVYALAAIPSVILMWRITR